MKQSPLQDLKTEHKQDEENEYKGSFASVMLLGLFLIVSWVGVWILYLVR